MDKADNDSQSRAALLAFVFTRTWTKMLQKSGITSVPFTRHENTMIQTCSVACYSIAIGGGYGAYLLALNKKSYKLSVLTMEQCDDLYKERMAALLRAVYATKYVKDDVVPAQIEEGLYLGSVGAANNKTHLKSLNITHMLTVATSLLPAYPTEFTYKVIDVPDKAEVDIAHFFDECFTFINEGKRLGGVLVHCFVGRSRSVTIVVAYLMKKHGMSLSEALNLVKGKRSVAAPNSGFMLQLQNYEKSLQGV